MTGVAERLTWWLVGSSQLGCSLVGQRAGHSDAPCPGEKPPPEVLMLDFYIFTSPVIILAFIEEIEDYKRVLVIHQKNYIQPEMLVAKELVARGP